MNAAKPVIFLTFANDKVDDAMYLRNLPKELHGIRESLDIAAKAGLCEIVERTAATVDQIFDVFQDPTFKDRIAIFHYGGHADGKQLMLETLEGEKQESNSEGLVPFFASQQGLQLVFFNGCSSQQQAEEMVAAGVPAVIGTSTAINDGVATDLSIRFYKGIAHGESIEQAWLHAIDAVKTKKGNGGHRGLKLRRDKSSEFPWNIMIRPGAEIVKEWNLPMAVNNPLFGLPDLPKLNLPEKPFLFLRRYQREYAEIFFGRGTSIRKLYDRATAETAAPVILFYGQSGVGKSSLLDAGLLPRLEQVAEVKYLRRDEDIGLLGMLDEVLGGRFENMMVEAKDGNLINIEMMELKLQQIAMLAEGLDQETHGSILEELNKAEIRLNNIIEQQKAKEPKNTPTNEQNRLERWKEIEETNGKPLIILFDQVEEVFTRSNDKYPDELATFLQEIKAIFGNPNFKPKGKIILSYRKEFQPEINEKCKKLKIPRESIFLKRLEKNDIAEVVTGLISTERLRNRYNVTVDPDLPVVIADDLLAEKESPSAPMLQIILTELWDMTEHDDVKHFSIKNYQTLRQKGLLMDDFFDQQMQRLYDWNPELVASGLALDLLNYHITALGTAGQRNQKQLERRYEHQGEYLEALVNKLKELYLLADAGNGRTCLSHDTLAPIIQKEVRNSDRPGQRALRVLSNKLPAYVANEKILLDRFQLKDVLNGKHGMRLWSSNEQEMVEKSKKRLVFKRVRQGVWAIATVMLIGAIYGWTENIRNRAVEETQKALSAVHLTKAKAEEEIKTYEQEKERLLDLVKKSKNDAKNNEEEILVELNRLIYERDTLLKTRYTLQRRNDNLSEMNERLALEKVALKQQGSTIDSTLIIQLEQQQAENLKLKIVNDSLKTLLQNTTTPQDTTKNSE